jgi:hypothetical protein
MTHDLDPQRAETALSWQEKIKARIAGELPVTRIDERPEFKARLIARHTEIVQRVAEISEEAKQLMREAEDIEVRLGDLVPKEVTEG